MKSCHDTANDAKYSNMTSDRVKPVKHRNRSTLSCEACRKRKARCDRKHPCTNCVRWRVETCVYSARSSPAGGDNSFSITSATNGTELPSHRKLAPQPHYGAAHNEVEKSTSSSPRTSLTAQSPDSDLAGGHIWRSTAIASIFMGAPEKGPVENDPKDTPFTNNWENGGVNGSPSEPLFPPLDGIRGPILGAFYKNRYIGQSHWMYAWAIHLRGMSTVGEEMKAKGDTFKAFQDCKVLARITKAQRPAAYPKVPCTEYGEQLPAYHLAVRLLDGYLETFETVYRILMVPLFKEQFTSIWSQESGRPKPSRELIIQAQLCMAIGAQVCPEGADLGLLVMQWVSEGCAWVAHSTQKHKLSVMGVQTLCLIHLARQACAVEANLAWVPAGFSLRNAMVMGFHIDPSMLPKMSAEDAELRRRLWTTILEITIESSLAAGAPPLISLDDYSCKVPSNCNDKDLLASGAAGSGALPEVTKLCGVFTDTSAQIALAKSFETRLSIAKTVNHHVKAMSTSYADLVVLTKKLDVACRQLRSDLSNPQASSFQTRYCNMMLERYYLVMHIAYLSLSVQNPAGPYGLSRTLCVDTALRMIHSGLTSSSDVFKNSHLAALMRPAESSYFTANNSPTPISLDRFAMLLLHGSGHLRSIPLQCLVVVAFELINRLARSNDINHPSTSSSRSSTPMLSAPLSQPEGAIGHFESLRDVELHLLLRVGLEWTKKRLAESGDRCVKDHCFMALLLALAEEHLGPTPAPDQIGPGKTNADTEQQDIEKDKIVRQRYLAAFLDCKGVLQERIERGRQQAQIDTIIEAGSSRNVSINPEITSAYDHIVQAVPELTLSQTSAAHSVNAAWFGSAFTGMDVTPLVQGVMDLHGDGVIGFPEDVDMGDANIFDGFWMGDLSDEFEWDGTMDFGSC